jgi:hypothetical protein
MHDPPRLLSEGDEGVKVAGVVRSAFTRLNWLGSECPEFDHRLPHAWDSSYAASQWV